MLICMSLTPEAAGEGWASTHGPPETSRRSRRPFKVSVAAREGGVTTGI